MINFPSILEGIDDLNKDQIDALLKLAKKFKERVNSTTHYPFPSPIIATSFLEHSTRTKHSFAMAIEKLGGTYMDFNAEKSSLKKGEGLEETLLTLFAQGIPLCIVRSSESHFLRPLKKTPPIKIINGGDGSNEHPTQALLDLFTLLEVEKDITGKKLVIIGDCKHSRVTHSLVKLLPQYGLEIILSGPEDMAKDYAKANGLNYIKDVDEAIKQSDFLYLLRVQTERHSSNSEIKKDDYFQSYGISLERYKKLKLTRPVYHPGPANLGVEIEAALLRTGHYRGYEQVRNSVFVRMAIIQAMLQNGDKNVGQPTMQDLI